MITDQQIYRYCNDKKYNYTHCFRIVYRLVEPSDDIVQPLLDFRLKHIKKLCSHQLYLARQLLLGGPIKIDNSSIPENAQAVEIRTPDIIDVESTCGQETT